MEQIIFWLLIILLTAGFITDIILDYLNQSQWKSKLPTSLQDFYDQATYEKAADYNKTHFKIGTLSGFLNLLIFLIFLVFGIFGWIDIWLRTLISDPVWLALSYFGILLLGSQIINLPFSLYSTFVIEEKFGFNKTNLKTFFSDKLKGLLLSVLIGGTLAGILFWLIIVIGPSFWLYGIIVFALFSVFMNYFYTTLIVPLFNKLTPLPEGSLRNAIEKVAGEADFPVTNIYVIDGSKRSSKANAFFSGFGKNKKIVLYDTLIEDHTEEELLSILAHEIGHYQKGHIRLNLILSLVQTTIMMFLLSRFVYSESVSLAMGAEVLSLHLNLIAFGIIYGPISMIMGLLMNVFSRKHEFEADAFAAKLTGTPESLQSALKKMSVKHLSNLHPHPAYVFLHYSHPPIIKRLNELDKFKSLNYDTKETT